LGNTTCRVETAPIILSSIGKRTLIEKPGVHERFEKVKREREVQSFRMRNNRALREGGEG